MKIALIGYGKMGRAIEAIARKERIEVVATFKNGDDLDVLKNKEVDVAIEFTQPDAAFDNITFCINQGIPVISGTTGWTSQLESIKALCEEKNGTFLYASNFSIGVNLFFELNRWLAKRMQMLGFKPEITEIHHTEKKDSPSGTAITLAEGILASNPAFEDWINEKSADHKKIGIISERKPNVPGTHTVSYSSQMETISINHEAHSRDVFAQGVIKVAQWITNQQGFLTMSDFINHK
ncbi:MAG: 4-hydroxy-tetrahydrodipicolinate reductase [Ekhidna sp.]